MNAAEIIEQIEKLPLEEKSKVVDFVRHLPNEETLMAMEEAKHPERLDSFKSSKEVFESLGIEC